MSESSGLTGLIVALINHRKNKKIRRLINEQNEQNQGIARYYPCDIEAFFDENEPIGNMAFSGGASYIRCREISREIECAILQGYSVVVLHCGDRELEDYLLNTFGNQFFAAVYKGNPIYDPFYERSNAEIDRLVMSSCVKGTEIGPTGKNYLDGMSDFMRAKGKVPFLDMYFTCPHSQLIQMVNDHENQGRISSADARNIMAELLQGETERSNVQYFFERLRNQTPYMVPQSSQLNNSINVEKAAKRGQILSIDLQNTVNTLLLNMVLNEVELELESGRKMLLVCDNLPLASSENLENLVKKSSSKFNITLSSGDVYSLFGSDENAFFSFMGKCTKAIISKHVSSFSCQKWSDYIGSYDKQEITSTMAENTNYYDKWSFGGTRTMNVNVKRENIVKAEEIARINDNDVLVVNNNTGEIAFTQVL